MRVGSFLTRKYSKWKQVWCEDDCWRVLDKMSAVCWGGGGNGKQSIRSRVRFEYGKCIYYSFVCGSSISVRAMNARDRRGGGG